MMQPKSGEIIKRMVTVGIESATALATAAGVSRASATKVMRGEKVSLTVAVKVSAAIDASRSVTNLFASEFSSMNDDFEGVE